MSEKVARNHKTEMRCCPVCAINYYADPVRLRHGRQTTCSKVCSYKLRALGMSGPLATIDCAWCNIKVARAVGKIKAKHGASYCSKACHYAGRRAGITPRTCSRPYRITAAGRMARKEAGQRAVATRKYRGNYRHSDATKAKLRDATTRQIMNGEINRVSGIEDVVAEELSRLGIAFHRQFGLRGEGGRYVACLDFMLTNYSTAIEVNGTFWHADPRFYDPRKLCPSQARTVERYTRKVDLLRKSGLQLIEIWEHDLEKNPAHAVRDALRRVIG